MYGISPEDRLWMVNRDQAERRQLATSDRIAAAGDGRRARRDQAGSARLAGVRHSWVALSHALHALARPHVHVTAHDGAH